MTYDDLKSAIQDWAHRTDILPRIDDFIDLCEAELQVKCKTVDFENTATLSVVAGSATLPADFAGARAVYWDGTSDRPLTYRTPAAFSLVQNNDGGTPVWFTVIGTTIKVAPVGDGDLVLNYKARFTPLSSSATSNAILANYPDAYLQGCLTQVAIFTEDMDGLAAHKPLFLDAIGRIIEDDLHRKYPGPLEVKAR